MMGKTVTKTGTSPLVIIFLVVLVLVVLAGLVAIVRIVNPELLYPITGDPTEEAIRQNIKLEGEVSNLTSELNATHAEIGALRAELRREQLRGFKWPVLIGILIVGAVIVYFLWRGLRESRLLTIKAAEKKYIPEARERYGYSEDEYPMVKRRPKAIERVKRKSSIDKDERMFFLEFEFIKRGRENAYIKGVRRPRRENVITVALLNGSDEVNQQWYPFTSLPEAMREAHEVELWGFALQKTRQEDDELAALQAGSNTRERKAQYQDPAEEGAQ